MLHFYNFIINYEKPKQEFIIDLKYLKKKHMYIQK